MKKLDEVEEFDDAVRVRAPKRLHRTHVKTLPYPGYPTDMQPQIAVTLALAEGTSIVTESIFENRFKYADELSRMGANIKVEGNSAIIDGVKKLTGASKCTGSACRCSPGDRRSCSRWNHSC